MCALGSFTVLRIAIPTPRLATGSYWPGPCIFSLVFFFGRLASPLGPSFFFGRQSAETEIFFPGGRGKKEKRAPPSAVETRWQPGDWLRKPSAGAYSVLLLKPGFGSRLAAAAAAQIQP
jgi:hypothetical protein